MMHLFLGLLFTALLTGCNKNVEPDLVREVDDVVTIVGDTETLDKDIKATNA